jgi:hypothetical protein
MPIPKPTEGETKDEFMNRCMGDDVMVKEYEQDQRWQVCNSSWEESKNQKASARKRQLEVLQAEIEL